MGTMVLMTDLLVSLPWGIGYGNHGTYDRSTREFAVVQFVFGKRNDASISCNHHFVHFVLVDLHFQKSDVCFL